MAIELPDSLWVHEGSVSKIRADIRQYLSELAPIGPESPLRGRFAGYPGTFDGIFPCLVIQSSGARGRHERAPATPESLLFNVQVYDILGRTPEEIADRITQAEDACWEGYEIWLEAFDADRQLHSRFRDADIPEVATGATNRVGREFIDIRSGDRLWRLNAELRLRL